MATQPTLKTTEDASPAPGSAPHAGKTSVPELPLVGPLTTKVDINEVTASPGFHIGDQLCEACGYQLRGTRSIRCPECAFIIPRPLSTDAAAEIRRSKHAIWNRINPWLWLLGICGVVLAVGFAPRMFAVSAIRGVAVSLIFLATFISIVVWHKQKKDLLTKSRWRLCLEGLGLIALSVLILMMTSRLALMS
jgi:hypothetical protein